MDLDKSKEGWEVVEEKSLYSKECENFAVLAKTYGIPNPSSEVFGNNKKTLKDLLSDPTTHLQEKMAALAREGVHVYLYDRRFLSEAQDVLAEFDTLLSSQITSTFFGGLQTQLTKEIWRQYSYLPFYVALNLAYTYSSVYQDKLQCFYYEKKAKAYFNFCLSESNDKKKEEENKENKNYLVEPEFALLYYKTYLEYDEHNEDDEDPDSEEYPKDNSEEVANYMALSSLWMEYYNRHPDSGADVFAYDCLYNAYRSQAAESRENCFDTEKANHDAEKCATCRSLKSCDMHISLFCGLISSLSDCISSSKNETSFCFDRKESLQYLLGHATYELALLHFKKNDFEVALERFEQARHLYSAVLHKRQNAMFYGFCEWCRSITLAEITKDDQSAAMHHLERARDLMSAYIGERNPRAADAAFSEGRTLHKEDNYAGARLAYQKAERMYARIVSILDQDLQNVQHLENKKNNDFIMYNEKDKSALKRQIEKRRSNIEFKQFEASVEALLMSSSQHYEDYKKSNKRYRSRKRETAQKYVDACDNELLPAHALALEKNETFSQKNKRAIQKLLFNSCASIHKQCSEMYRHVLADEKNEISHLEKLVFYRKRLLELFPL